MDNVPHKMKYKNKETKINHKFIFNTHKSIIESDFRMITLSWVL